MTFVILKLLGKSFLIVVFIVCYVYSIFKNRKTKKINIVLYVIIGGWLIFAAVYVVIPTVCDIKNIVYSSYYTVSGTVKSWDFSDSERVQNRSVGIKDEETNEIINVNIYSTGIEKGDYLKVSYLPCTKYGVIISHKETK